MFRADNATAEVQRFVYENGKSTGKETVGSYRGYMTIVDARKLVDTKLYGKAYEFNTEYGADIQKSDDLVIDGQSYSVQIVEPFKGRRLSFTRVEMIKND